MPDVVITGAGKGIGLATAQVFAEHGWRVFAMYRDASTVPSVTGCVPVHLDMRSAESIENAAREISEQTQSLSVLVNNAGILNDSQEHEVDLQKVRETFDVNLFGLIDFTERLLPILSDGAHVVNMSSIYGAFSYDLDGTFAAGYRMSKAALNMYTRLLAKRLEGKCTVSSMHPGWIKTEMGYSVASGTDQPHKEPSAAALDVWNLVNKKHKSGRFWFEGKEREW